LVDKALERHVGFVGRLPGRELGPDRGRRQLDHLDLALKLHAKPSARPSADAARKAARRRPSSTASTSGSRQKNGQLRPTATSNIGSTGSPSASRSTQAGG